MHMIKKGQMHSAGTQQLSAARQFYVLAAYEGNRRDAGRPLKPFIQPSGANVIAKIAEPIPVIVVSGFLGSGKTTLLNLLLQEMPDSAVVINEFGAVPIDQQLLREHDIALSLLPGGCMCCQVRDTLIPVLKNLRMAWESRRVFGRIIIETSGAANPENVTDILLGHHWLAKRLQLQSLITTVSAATPDEYFERFSELQAQIAWADTIVLTQSDLASDRQLEALQDRLARLAPATPVFTAERGRIDVGNLVETPKTFGKLARGQAAEVPGHRFVSITVRLERPMAWESFQKALAAMIIRCGGRLIRVKGLVYTPEDNRPLLIQGAADRIFPPMRLPPRPSDDSIGRLVLISDGTINNLAEDLMADLGL